MFWKKRSTAETNDSSGNCNNVPVEEETYEPSNHEGEYYEWRRPQFDPYYVATLPGILKAIQIPSSLATFVCLVIANYNNEYVIFANGVTLLSFLISTILLILYMAHIIENTAKSCRWLLWECIHCGVWTVCYIPTFACLCYYASRLRYQHTWGAGAFFCIIALFSYGADFVIKLRARRRGDPPQLSHYPADVDDENVERLEYDPPPPSYFHATSPGPTTPLSDPPTTTKFKFPWTRQPKEPEPEADHSDPDTPPGISGRPGKVKLPWKRSSNETDTKPLEASPRVISYTRPTTAPPPGPAAQPVPMPRQSRQDKSHVTFV